VHDRLLVFGATRVATGARILPDQAHAERQIWRYLMTYTSAAVSRARRDRFVDDDRAGVIAERVQPRIRTFDSR
jgi:hypothetical protein